jgi:hypothetical protein
VRKQTIESRRGTRCADGLLPPQPHQLQPARALSSHDRPRSPFKRVSTPSFVSRSPPESFPSSRKHNHHQIGRIRISVSRVGPRNFSAASQVLLSFLLFCRSSLFKDDVLWKAFCGTPHLQQSVSPDPQSNSSLPVRPYRIRRTLHVLLVRCLTGADEYPSRKTGHFAYWERLGATRSTLILCLITALS